MWYANRDPNTLEITALTRQRQSESQDALADDHPDIVAFLHPEQTLEGQRALKISELSAACHAAIVAGFESSALGVAHRYDSDLEAQLNLVGAAGLGTGLEYTCTEVASGVKSAKPHTAAQIAQVFQEGASVKLALLAQFRARKAAAEGAATEAELAAVVW